MRAQLDAVSRTSASMRRRRACSSRGRSSKSLQNPSGYSPSPLVVDPGDVSASSAQLFQDDAGEALVTRLSPGQRRDAETSTRHGCSVRWSPRTEGAGRRLHALGAPAVLVTGGHGERAVDRPSPPGSHGGSGRATRCGCDPRRGLYALRDADGAARPGRVPRRSGAGAAEAAADAIGHGLVDLGEGEGTVDVLHVADARWSRRAGLLAELEQRGLATGLADDAAQLEGGLVVTPDTLVEGMHFAFDRISWRELGYRAAAVNLSDLAASGPHPKGSSSPWHSRRGGARVRARALVGIAETSVPIISSDTTAAEHVFLSVTALGRSERDPDAQAPSPATSSSSPARSEQQAPPFVRAGSPGRDPARGRADAGLACARADRRLRRNRARRDSPRRALRVPPGHRARPRPAGGRCDRRRPRVRRGLRAAGGVVDSSRFTVVGRCEEGAGVELLLDGRPYDLASWEHFR